MKITTETVDYVSTLARLRLDEVEKEQMAGELGAILGYMETLNELDTGDIEPMSHVLPLKNVLRADEIGPSTIRAELLAGAPQTDGESFRVPKAVE